MCLLSNDIADNEEARQTIVEISSRGICLPKWWERKEKPDGAGVKRKKKNRFVGSGCASVSDSMDVFSAMAFAEGKAYEHIVPDSDSSYLTEADIAGWTPRCSAMPRTRFMPATEDSLCPKN